MGDSKETSLAGKIQKDLEDSGLGSEMNAVKILIDNGWDCTPSYYFRDQDSKKLRELDILAARKWHDENPVRHVEFNLAVEVKKSGQPWVSLAKPFEGVYDPYPTVLPHHGNFREIPLNESQLCAEIGWIGYGVHQAFRSNKKHGVIDYKDFGWRSAAFSACKCAAALKARYYTRPKPSTFSRRRKYMSPQRNMLGDSSWSVYVHRPVVILDGRLFRGWLAPNGSIKSKEVSLAPTLVHFDISDAVRSHFLVDLVTLQGLNEYLFRLEEIGSEMDRFMEANSPFLHNRNE